LNKPKLTDAQQILFESMLRRFEQGEPLQYIVGHTEFMGFPIYVDPRVLIPRPETEILVDEAIKLLPKDRPLDVLELGTGSGCISIALAKHLPLARITALDISAEALVVARDNAIVNDVDDRIRFEQEDMADVLAWAGMYDMIISNPPYIRRADLKSLPRDVQREPKLALDGGDDGLKFYRVIVERAKMHLKTGGLLCLEVGDGQSSAVRDMLDDQLGFTDIQCVPDYVGTPRVICAKRA
jgi:release factor glutamine methyltransferase